MTAHVLISGVIFRPAERKTSKNGKPFTVATLKVAGQAESHFWSVVCFEQAVSDELCRLEAGDAIAIQGPLSVETYEHAGATRINRKIVAQAVLSLRQPGALKAKTDKTAEPTARRAPDRSRLDRHAGDGADYFGDAIPF